MSGLVHFKSNWSLVQLMSGLVHFKSNSSLVQLMSGLVHFKSNWSLVQLMSGLVHFKSNKSSGPVFEIKLMSKRQYFGLGKQFISVYWTTSDDAPRKQVLPYIEQYHKYNV